MSALGIIAIIFLAVAAVVGLCIMFTLKLPKDDNTTMEPVKRKPAMERYVELELGDSVDKVFDCLGTPLSRDLLSNGVVRYTWKKVYGGSSCGIRGTGMRFYQPQTTKKIVVKIKDDKVIEVKANNI